MLQQLVFSNPLLKFLPADKEVVVAINLPKPHSSAQTALSGPSAAPRTTANHHARSPRPPVAKAVVYLDVAVTTKYRLGRSSCNFRSTASLPTPLGPLTTRTTGSASGTCTGFADDILVLNFVQLQTEERTYRTHSAERADTPLEIRQADLRVHKLLTLLGRDSCRACAERAGGACCSRLCQTTATAAAQLCAQLLVGGQTSDCSASMQQDHGLAS